MLDIFEVIRPLHLVSRIFGLTPFTVKQEKGEWNAVISLWNIFWIFPISILLTSSVAIFTFHHENLFHLVNVPVSEVVELSLTMTCVSFYLAVQLIILITFFMRQSIVKCLNIIVTIDGELKSHGISVDYRGHKKILLILIGVFEAFMLLVISLGIFSVQEYSSFSLNSYILITSLFSVNFSLLFYIHFTLIMWTIKVRYRNVNRFMCESFSILNGSDNAKLSNLNKAARLHDMLVSACECVNAGYGISVRNSTCLRMKGIDVTV